MNSVIGFKKLSVHAFLPTRGSPKSAGLDLRSPYKVIIPKHGKNLILTDLAVQLPPNCYGRIASRSGLALKNFIEVAGGVIDADYTGNIGVILYNHSDEDYVVEVGDRIAQLVCEVILYPDAVEIFEIRDTERNTDGFGSTVMSSAAKLPVEESATVKPGMIGLFQIIQNLIVLGLNSIGLWHEVIPKIKTNDLFTSHPELLDLHLLLSQVSQHLYSKVFEFFPNDLSQEKLPRLLEAKISLKDLLKKIKPLLKKKNFSDRSFSIESSKSLNAAVEDAIASLNGFTESDSVVNDGDLVIANQSTSKRERKTSAKGGAKRQRIDRSPSQSGSSSGSDSSNHSASESDSDSASDSENFDKLFRITPGKKGPVKIKQVFQTQKKRLRRRLSTPGEEGRYMIKIELTDTKDLRKCKPTQFWTKVSTKAIFLAEPKSSTFKQLKSMLYNVGHDIKSTPGVEIEELKLDRKTK